MSPAAIAKSVARRYGVTLDELCGGSKDPRVAEARSVFAWVAEHEFVVRRQRIAEACGRGSYITAREWIHATRKRMDLCPLYAASVRRVAAEIRRELTNA